MHTSRSDLCGLRILVADDNTHLQGLYSWVLREGGADVVAKENGRLAVDAAMAALREKSPHEVILMDMQMPVMDGYEASRQLRQKGYTGLIIAVTACATNGSREKCIDAGCDDYISKPFEWTELINLIVRKLQDS